MNFGPLCMLRDFGNNWDLLGNFPGQNCCLLNRLFHHEQDLKSHLEEVILFLLKLQMGREMDDVRDTEEAALGKDIQPVSCR